MSQDGEQESATPAGQVLEFDLGSEPYCVDIQYVTEIVRPTEITTAPNTPAHVKGVMDLRGSTTTIVDPRELLNVEIGRGSDRVVVFEPSLFGDNRSVGWVVDRTRQVISVSADEVDESSAYDDFIKGIVKRDGRFIVWIEPPDLHS